MNEWNIDKNSGIFIHELYKDVRNAGVGEKTNGRIYGNRPSDYFEDGWKAVFTNNLSKYTALSKIPITIKDSLVKVNEGNLVLKVDLAPHSVKLIELIPQ